MTSFYEKAIVDKLLGPYFTHELGEDLRNEDWIHHIDLLADFWLAKILGHNTYEGSFIGAHVKMPTITKESFERWVTLFSQTADEVYNSDIAKVFKKKAQQFSLEFQNSAKKL